jgi:hypothetical protein
MMCRSSHQSVDDVRARRRLGNEGDVSMALACSGEQITDSSP